MSSLVLQSTFKGTFTLSLGFLAGVHAELQELKVVPRVLRFGLRSLSATTPQPRRVQLKGW